jgi:hypothetical protein
MRGISSLACSLILAVAAIACGGSKGDGPPAGPLAPGPSAGPTLPPISGLANGYFDFLSARSDVLGAYSLRDQAMLDAYAHGPGSGSLSFTYDFANDPDPRKQDAAKVVVPADKAHVQSQIRFPIPPLQGESLLVSWDTWWGKEFAYANTRIGSYKAFQFASPAVQIWTEVKSDFAKAVRFPPAIAMVEIRAYGEKKNGELGPNVTDDNPLSPMTAEFGIMPETWTRYWVYFRPAGEWHTFSVWMADETRAPVQLINALQMKPSPGGDGWESFWLEYNTSSASIPATRGPLVAYIRNVVMLKGVSDPTALLQSPIR